MGRHFPPPSRLRRPRPAAGSPSSASPPPARPVWCTCREIPQEPVRNVAPQTPCASGLGGVWVSFSLGKFCQVGTVGTFLLSPPAPHELGSPHPTLSSCPEENTGQTGTQHQWELSVCLSPFSFLQNMGSLRAQTENLRTPWSSSGCQGHGREDTVCQPWLPKPEAAARTAALGGVFFHFCL